MRIISVLGLVVLSCLAPPASAGIVLSVDLDAATAGIQANRTYMAGETVLANLVLELTAPTRISQYSFSVRYDATELTFVSRSETPGNIVGWSEINPALSGSAPGLLFNFDAFGPVLAGPQGPFVVGSVTFTAQSPSGNAGEFDIEVGPFNPNAGFDGFVDDGNPPMFVPDNQISYRSASVSAVPEPATMSLGGYALIAGLMFRRRHSRGPSAS